MRISIQKSTGLLIEMQSRAKEGTLTKNAVAMGYDVNDIEESVATDQEYRVLAAAQAPPVPPAEPTVTELITALKTKGVIADADIASAKVAVAAGKAAKVAIAKP